MLIYFCLYAFWGYLLESSYRSIIEKRWISSGLLDAPFIPLYGFGAISLLLYDYYFEYNIFIGASILILLELLSSYLIEFIFKIKYWNYSKHILNYEGRICLYYSLIWLLMSYIFYYYIHPFVSLFIKPNEINNLISVIIIIYIIIQTKKRIR